MSDYKEKVNRFLELKNVAVTGVSRNPSGKLGNVLYKKFKDSGYNVFAVNPNGGEVEGIKLYPDLKSVPEKIEGVVIAARPETADATVKECMELKINNVWFHSSFGNGSYSPGAAEYCRKNGISVIEAGCPMMHIKPVDIAHKCFRFVFTLTGKLK